MNKTICLVISILVSSVVFSQRRNNLGLKMVQNLHITWTNYEHEYLDWLSWDIDFYYGDDGKLSGIDKKSVDDGTVFFEQYRRVGDSIKYTLYKNGKIQTDKKVKFDYDSRSNTIRKRVTDWPVYYDDGEIAYWEKNIYNYSRYKMRCTVYKNYNEKIDSIDRRIAKSLAIRYSSGLQDLDLSIGDLDELVSFVIGKDGYIYHINRDIISRYTYINGNMQIGIVQDYDRFYKRIIYLDRKNDTNLEFYPLSRVFILSSCYENIECITEWVNLHSKNLISFSGKWGDSFDCQWEYGYDDRGNINRIDLLCKEWNSSRCSIKIKYVEP